MKIKDVYSGEDLGAAYAPSHTTFRVWAPTAGEVELWLYPRGDGEEVLRKLPMSHDDHGTWYVSVDGDLNHIYYTYRIRRGKKVVYAQDPYAVAAGINGMRSMVVDLRETDPQGFAKDRGPKVKNRTDLIICEISVADMTADSSAGVAHPGKFLGLTEQKTKNKNGQMTGLSYLKELGITHVQIMPMFDFASINEAYTDHEQYNWGYDPFNYNVPEGSYATDPYHGEVRIREMKEMIAAFHKAGIGVIMDVVYNHTYDLNHCLQKCEPDYYYRKKGKAYANGSGCGNEIASERPMARKYIVDSVCYWAREYHLDGFRFDLMGVLDVDTLNELGEKLRKINPSIVLYGEGWTGGYSPFPEHSRAVKKNVRLLEGFGMFSDDIRDAIRGAVFYNRERGFVGGKQEMENAVRFGTVGAVWHPQVDYGSYHYTESGPWATNPCEVISYASCHDNLTLWDKLAVSCAEKSKEERYAMNRLAAAMVFTAQGTPFFLSGEEFARTKPIAQSGQVSENSFNLPLSTNALRYNWDEEQLALIAYYRGLIAFRKAHSGLRLATAEEVQTKIRFVEGLPAQVVAFFIREAEETVFVVYNASENRVLVDFPEVGDWELFIDGTHAGTQALALEKKTAAVAAVSCSVYVKKH